MASTTHLPRQCFFFTPHTRQVVGLSLWLLMLLSHTNPHAQQAITETFDSPMEYCVLSQEYGEDVRKWSWRFNFPVPAAHRLKSGDVYVMLTHPDFPDDVWFSNGEEPTSSGYRLGHWFHISEYGPIPYSPYGQALGVLYPVIPINVVSKPLDLSDLSGGKVTVSYGLRGPGQGRLDSYREMIDSGLETRGVSRRIESTAPGESAFVSECLIVTGIKRKLWCLHCPGELLQESLAR